MQVRHIEIGQPSIEHGRIYFPTTDVKFFPSDCFGDRSRNGSRGKEIVMRAGSFTFVSDVRVSSGARLSPRRSFKCFLTERRARAGDTLRVTRTGDREYIVEHIPTL